MRKNATLKDRSASLSSTITVTNGIMVCRYKAPTGPQKMAFKMQEKTINELLDICHHFNAGMSMTIGKRIYQEFGLPDLHGYVYLQANDEFGLTIEQKIPIETLILDGCYTSQGVLLNMRVGVDGHSFTVQYEINLFRQVSAIREITRELLRYTK